MKKDKRKYVVENKINGEIVKEFKNYTSAWNLKITLERKKPYMFFGIRIVDENNKTIIFHND